MRTIGICLRRPCQASGGRNGTPAGVMASPGAGQGIKKPARPARAVDAWRRTSMAGGWIMITEGWTTTLRGRARMDWRFVHGGARGEVLALALFPVPLRHVPPSSSYGPPRRDNRHRRRARRPGPGAHRGCKKTSNVIRSLTVEVVLKQTQPAPQKPAQTPGHRSGETAPLGWRISDRRLLRGSYGFQWRPTDPGQPG